MSDFTEYNIQSPLIRLKCNDSESYSESDSNSYSDSDDPLDLSPTGNSNRKAYDPSGREHSPNAAGSVLEPKKPFNRKEYMKNYMRGYMMMKQTTETKEN